MDKRLGLLLPLALLLGGCFESDKTHTLKLKVTHPSGEVERIKIKGPSTFDGVLSPPMVYFPNDYYELQEWMLFSATPFLPGTYETINATLSTTKGFYDTYAGGVTIDMEEVKWTGKSRFPFEYKGSLSGTIQGAEVEGDFTITSLNCHRWTSVGHIGCGGDFLWGRGDERVEVDLAMPELPTDGCPSELTDRFWDGDTLHLTRKSITVGEDTERLECVEVQPGAWDGFWANLIYDGAPEKGDIGPYSCGGSYKRIEADGCDDWRVTAYAHPYNNGGYPGVAYGIYAGADCGGRDRWCYSRINATQVIEERTTSTQ